MLPAAPMINVVEGTLVHFCLTVASAVSRWVAAQLARTFSASSEGAPGSAV